jgi:hypothetical protein
VGTWLNLISTHKHRQAWFSGRCLSSQSRTCGEEQGFLVRHSAPFLYLITIFSSSFHLSVFFRLPALLLFRKHWILHCLQNPGVPLSHRFSGFHGWVWKSSNSWESSQYSH